jgi:hypothetical protein
MNTKMRVAILSTVLLISARPTAHAEKKGALDLSSASTIADVLNDLRGKTVLLRLSNGTSIEGLLSKKSDGESAHTQLVQIEEISGKELFSAMILKSSIIGVEYRR